MHRIDGAGATSDNRFTDGDPASATAATVVTDDWLNAVQEEIVSVISDPAVTPAIALDKTKTNQLVTAIKRIISASAIAYSQASETVAGFAKIATQTLVNAGADDSSFVTPKKLRWGFAISATTNGYIALPSWLGGLIIQWGVTTDIATDSSFTVTFPIQFTVLPFGISSIGVNDNSTTSKDNVPQLVSRSVTSMVLRANGVSGSTTAAPQIWIAVGI